MKKTFRIIGLMVVAVIAACSMSACSDDEEGEPADPTNHDQELVGTWHATYDNGTEKGDWTITFGRDGKFVSNEEYWSEEDGNYKYWVSGSWETLGNKLKLTLQSASDPDEIDAGETITETYSVDGNTMTFHDSSAVFTRK